MSKTLDEVLEDLLLYEPCDDFSCRGRCHPFKRNSSKQAILQWAADLVGENEEQPVEYYDEVEQSNVRKVPTEKMITRNQMRAEIREKLKAEGWKDE